MIDYDHENELTAGEATKVGAGCLIIILASMVVFCLALFFVGALMP